MLDRRLAKADVYMADLVNQVFVRALQTYQQQHGQEVTYRFEELLGPNADTQDSVDTEQQQANNELESTRLHPPAEQQDTAEPRSVQDGGASEGLLNSQQESAPKHAQPATKQIQPEQHSNGLPACQLPDSEHRPRRRYTTERMLQLQHQLPLSSPKQEASSGSQAHQTAQQPEAAVINQGLQHQQQSQHKSQWQWDPACYWDATAWSNHWYQQGPASEVNGKNACTSGYQWGMAGPAAAAAAATHVPYMMPPPPPPSYPHTANESRAAACGLCGKTLSEAVAGARTAAAASESARDLEAVKQVLLRQVPSDVVSCTESLSAAQAAIDKAVAVCQASHCVKLMPELMMAWFYAGYHAGKVSSAQGSADSNGK